jgi:hypothetical protein
MLGGATINRGRPCLTLACRGSLFLHPIALQSPTALIFSFLKWQGGYPDDDWLQIKKNKRGVQAVALYALHEQKHVVVI